MMKTGEEDNEACCGVCVSGSSAVSGAAALCGGVGWSADEVEAKREGLMEAFCWSPAELS